MVESRQNYFNTAVDNSSFDFLHLRFQSLSKPPEKRSFSSAGFPFLQCLNAWSVILGTRFKFQLSDRAIATKISINRGEAQGNLRHVKYTVRWSLGKFHRKRREISRSETARKLRSIPGCLENVS